MATTPKDQANFIVDMEPIGRRAMIEPGTSLLDAARGSGVEIVSLCGGEGWCESCVVRLEKGKCSPPTESEILVFSKKMLQEGYRLACQAVPESDVKIYIPSESLSAPQRLQIEGKETDIELDPIVSAVDLEMVPPSLADLRADEERLLDALSGLGHPDLSLQFPLLDKLSDTLRDLHWKVRAVLRAEEVVVILPFGTRLFGLAVDIGTTKLAGYLVDLNTGVTIAKSGRMNPQIAYGEDVISRIAYTQNSDDGRKILQTCVVNAINEILAELCQTAEVAHEQVVQAVIVGNTAMHHLFAGLPVNQLALAPYVPSVNKGTAIQAERLGLNIPESCYIQLLPNIAGYVGADHVAAVLATEVWKAQDPTMVIDIGTNTEISLVVEGNIYSCSCASGPAFEGAHIRDGMRAAEGAIESFQLVNDQSYIFTIGNKPPVGICGSGILDIVAELRIAGILDSRGAFLPEHSGVRATDMGSEFVLVTAEKTGHGKEISISRRDINEIQLAKAAIRTGIDILLETAEIQADQISRVIVAGAFGTYIRLESAIKIGLLPDLPLEKFSQVGNAAGMGAKQVLISKNRLRLAEGLSNKVKYIELTTHPDFQAKFLKAIYL